MGPENKTKHNIINKQLQKSVENTHKKQRKQKRRTRNAVEDVSGGLAFGETIEETTEPLARSFDRSHPLFHLEVPEVLLSDPTLFSDPYDPFLREAPTQLPERRSGAGVRGHVEVHAPRVRGGGGGDEVAEPGPGVLGLGQAHVGERDLVVRGGAVGRIV